MSAATRKARSAAAVVLREGEPVTIIDARGTVTHTSAVIDIPTAQIGPVELGPWESRPRAWVQVAALPRPLAAGDTIASESARHIVETCRAYEGIYEIELRDDPARR